MANIKMQILRSNLTTKYYKNQQFWTQEYLRNTVLTESRELVLTPRISDSLKKSALEYFKRVADEEAR